MLGTAFATGVLRPTINQIIYLQVEDRFREAGATPLEPDAIIPPSEVELSVVRILSPRPLHSLPSQRTGPLPNPLKNLGLDPSLHPSLYAQDHALPG